MSFRFTTTGHNGTSARWPHPLVSAASLHLEGDGAGACRGVRSAPRLPPMAQWYSSLIPYPVLLPIQIALIGLMAKICRDVTAGNGYFASGSARVGRRLIGLSVIYFAVMIARYVIHMTLHPEARWLGGTIPIVFHFVLATFVLLLGRYYASLRLDPQHGGNGFLRRLTEGNPSTTRRRFLIAAERQPARWRWGRQRFCGAFRGSQRQRRNRSQRRERCSFAA